ncbi:C2 domain-containing protein 3 [Plecturocebus cupreus]
MVRAVGGFPADALTFSNFATNSHNRSETGSPYVDQADHKLLDSCDPPALASQNAGVTGMSYHAQPNRGLFMDKSEATMGALSHRPCRPRPNSLPPNLPEEETRRIARIFSSRYSQKD